MLRWDPLIMLEQPAESLVGTDIAKRETRRISFGDGPLRSLRPDEEFIFASLMRSLGVVMFERSPDDAIQMLCAEENEMVEAF